MNFTKLLLCCTALVTFQVLLVQCQLYFTEQERNRILDIHKQKLAKEALKIFENQIRHKSQNEIFNQMINYKGLYENLQIQSLEVNTLSCSEYLPQLNGFDYKRHKNRHYLLCFSNSSFVVQTFVVQKSRIALEQRPNAIKHVEGLVRQAILYRAYDADRLYVAVLIDRGVFSIKTYEVVDQQVLDKDTKHQFRLYERVVSIDVVQYATGKHRLVALIEAGNRHTNLFPERSKDIVKFVVKNAFKIKTVQMQAQGYVIFSNSSHWSVCRYQDDQIEMINTFMMRYPIRDIQVFHNGHRYYVGVVTENYQYLYQWKGKSGFKGIAKVFLKRVYKMNPVTISYAREDNFFYFDQHGSDSIVIYAYDITNSAFINLQTFSKKQIGYPNVVYNPAYSNHFYHRNVAFELKLSKSVIYVLAYDTAISHSKTKKSKLSVYNLQRYNKDIYERKIDNLKQNVFKLESKETISKRAVNLTFKFDVEFRANVIVNRFVSNDQKPPQRMIVNKRAYGNEDLLVPVSTLQSELNRISQWMNNIQHTLDTEVVYKSQNMLIDGLKEFVNRVFAARVHSKLTNVGMFRNEYISNILANLYRTSNNVLVTGRKVFMSQVLVENGAKVQQINKVDPGNYMFASLEQDVYSSLWYKKLTATDLMIGDQLAPNISFSKSILINQEGDTPIEIQNKLLFNDLHVDHLHVNAIDNVSISKLPSQVFMRNFPGLQTFKVRTKIPLIRTRSDLHADYINGYSASKIFQHLVRKNRIEHLKRDIHFNGDVFINFLNIDGAINGIRVPDDLLDKYSDQSVYGLKKFNRAEIKNLKSDYLNGLSIPDDIVTLSGDQVINYPLEVDALRLEGNLQVDGLIDNVNLTHLDQRFIASFKNNYKNLTFYKPVNVSHVNLVGHINGLNLDDLYRNAIFKNERNIHIPSTKTIANIFKCNSIKAGLVNGEQLENYVTTYKPEYFAGTVFFKNPVQFNDINLNDIIDGVRIADLLRDVVTLDTSQSLFGSKNFTDTVQIGDRILVHGLINQIPSSSFMLYSVPQNISGFQSFSDVYVNRLYSVPNVQLSGLLNGYNFTRQFSGLVNLRKPYVFESMLHCVNCSATELRTNWVNGKNFTHFCTNYVSKSTAQVIQGVKNFQALQTFTDIRTQSGIGGIDLRNLHQNAITLNGYNIVHKPVFIYNGLNMVNGKLTAKLFNNIDISNFYNRVVYKNWSDSTKIQGNILYRNGFDLHADMQVAYLNKHSPEELLLTNNRNYTIHSNVYFGGKVIVSGNINVTGKVNNVDLVELDRNILKTNKLGQIVGNVNFVKEIDAKEVNVNGYVDGIRLSADHILMRNTEQYIKQMVVDGSQSFNGHVNVLSRINDYHKDNLHNIVLANSVESQIINTTKTFARIDAVQVNQLKGDVHIQVVNNVNVQDFLKNAVYSSVDRVIKVKQRFLDNLTIINPDLKISGLVNGVNLSKDVVRLDVVNQTITGKKVFDKVILNDDIEVYGQLNSMDIRKLYNNILYIYGNQHVKNKVTFRAPIFLASNSSVEWINQVRPNDLITLNGKQQINGKFVFNNIMANKIYLSKNVNGVNLTDVSQYALKKNSDQLQIIHGALLVDKAVFNKPVELGYQLNNVDLSAAVESAQSKMDNRFDVKDVESNMEKYSKVLYHHVVQYEQANFDIEYFSKSNFSSKWLSKSSPDIVRFKSRLNTRSTTNVEYSLIDNKFEANWLKHVAERPKSQFQFFWLAGQFHVAETNEQNRETKLLEIYQLYDTVKKVRIYREEVRSDVQTLVFLMQNQIYILYGLQAASLSDTCAISLAKSTELRQINIDLQDLSVSVKLAQSFVETNLINIGHYADDSGQHYLVFNHKPNLYSPSQISVYKRGPGQCQFRLFQTLPVTDVQQIALFKFGTTSLVEQYLVTLSKSSFVVWKQEGVFGFSKTWSVATTSSLDGNSIAPGQVFAFVQDKSRLIIYAPTCPVDMFEAKLNGRFSHLFISYDDYL